MRGAIADDFTGATDLAGNWRARGLRTTVVLGVPDDDQLAILGRYDAVVIALKIRSAPIEEALAQVTAAADVLERPGCAQVYDKYCSTFDSTPRGNIGPIADLLLQRTGARSAVVVPGFPDAGRTVEQGRLYVHGQPLDESPMRHHPLNPMWDSRVPVLLEAQSRHRAGVIPLDVVRRGADAVVQARRSLEDDGVRYVVVDSVTNDDLAVVAAATARDRLVTGGSGLALGLPHAGGTPEPIPVAPGRRAILAGSASQATQRQVAHGRTAFPHRKVDVGAAVTDPGAHARELLGWAQRCWAEDPDRPVLVYSVASPEDVAAGKELTADASAVVESLFRDLAAQMMTAGARQFVVAGGETSGSVVQGLDVRRLDLGEALSPGVSWLAGHAGDGGEVVNLVLKSGNFGTDDLFTAAWEALS